MLELGIYGGTFAPVHIGHIAAAEAFLAQAGLDKLLIMPTLIPPHKQLTYKDDPKDRLNMLHLAFEDHEEYNKRLFISEYELNSPPPSYTVYTLKHFTEPNTHITFLCGTDMFLTLDKWKAPEEIFKLCRIAFMPREGDITEADKKLFEEKENFYKAEFGADIIRITAPAIEISSSQIRSGDDTFRKSYLPEKVYRYITERGLYERNQII